MITFLKKLIGDMAKYKCINKKSDYFEYNNIYNGDYKITKTINVSDLAKEFPENWQLVEDDFVLPEKWCIKITSKNYTEIHKWMSKSQSMYKLEVGDYTYGNNKKKYTSWSWRKQEDVLEITFEQFKKYVLGMENKKIIGYKLIKPEYKKPALTISKAVGHWENKLKEYDIHISQSRYLERLTSAGVLDLWFEPVYEEKFKVGDWVYGWHAKFNKYADKAWKIHSIDENYEYASPEPGYSTSINSLRKATNEEIEAAQNKLPIIAGYKGEDLKDGKVAYGCKVVLVKTLRELYSLGVSTIVIDGFKVTRGDIKQILKYFDNV